MGFEPDNDQVKELVVYAKCLISNVEDAYLRAVSIWRSPFDNLSAAYRWAYSQFNNALIDSRRFKKAIAEIGTFSLARVCGKGLEWVQSALMQDKFLFEADIQQIFGGFPKWLSLHRTSFNGVTIQNVPENQLPNLLSNISPVDFENKLNCFISDNVSNIERGFKALFEVLEGKPSGETLIRKLLGDSSIFDMASAKYRIHYIFDSELRHHLLNFNPFYIHDPNMPTQEEMKSRIERCMWAETFKANDPVPPKWLPNPLMGGPALGSSLEEVRQLMYKPGSAVEVRLVALGIMAPQGKRRDDRHPPYELDNFGRYTDDDELMQLRHWAHHHKPEYIGGPMDPSRMITSNRVWQNFRDATLRHLK